jgi:hypothetical protein
MPSISVRADARGLPGAHRTTASGNGSEVVVVDPSRSTAEAGAYPPQGLSSGVGAWGGPPRVLLYDPYGDHGLEIARRLRQHAEETSVTIAQSREVCRALDASRLDVALIRLTDGCCDGLALGAELRAALPWVEVSFWFEGRAGAPAAAAARSLGVTHVIPLAQLADWLEGALTHLVRIARARREQQSAERALPPLPTIEETEIALPMREAERLFRETYLRRMVSGSASLPAAARKAGVPYTTLLSMLKKMGAK